MESAQAEPLERIVRALDRVLAAFPNATSMHFERARALAALRDDVQAETSYLTVLQQNPQHFRAHNDLGLLYHRNGLTSHAADCFRSAVTVNPNNAGAHANLAYMLLAANDLAGAQRHFERALALNPEHPAARAGLAQLPQSGPS